LSAPIEALLRPPVEQSAIATHAALALLGIGAPQVLLLPGGVGYALAGACALRALWLTRRMARLLRYQRRLQVLPSYRIHPRLLRAPAGELFLGRGFQWHARHTQRYADTQRTEYSHVTRRNGLAQQARSALDALSTTPLKPLLAPLNSQWLLNPLPPRPYVEGSPELHGVGLYEKEQDVTLQQAERVAHTFVVGTTRVGKTRLLEVIATQDIRRGEVVIVFDPKGDGDLLARLYTEAQRAGRAEAFQVFHLGFPEQSVAYNPVGSFSRVTEVASRIAGQLPNEGNAAAFREFAWRYVNVLAKVLDILGEPINYQVLLECSTDIDALVVRYLACIAAQKAVTDWNEQVAALIDSEAKMPAQYKGRDRSAWASVEVFRRNGLSDPTATSLIKTFEHDKSHFDKLVASLYPLLEKLTSGPVAGLLSPESNLPVHDEQSIHQNTERLSWKRAIERGGIVYVGLDALSDPDVASAVGNAMFADLTSVAGSLYKDAQRGAPLKRVCVHADEFNELVGREFIPLANKAGGAGFQLTVYTQTLSDIIARFDNPARAGQVVGNLGTIIMLRVKDKATAELLTHRLKDVEINQLMIDSGSTDNADPDSAVHFTSTTRQRISSQRVPMIHAGDLDALPKGHAFALIAGRLYKLRLPLFSDDAELPSGLQAMVEAMRRDYAHGNVEGWADTTPLGWKP